MAFAVRAEHDALRDSVRAFLADTAPEAEVRRLMDDARGHDPDVWARMSTQLGPPGLIVPETYGGAGYGHAELGIVMEEMGRALAPAPLFASVALAANLLLSCADDDACASYLPGIAAGTTLATVALTERAGRWDEGGVICAAARVDGAWRLTGEKTYVVDGHAADLILVVARGPSGIGVFAVDGAAPGLSRMPLTVLDRTRKQARLTFDATPARRIGVDGDGWPAVARMLDLAAVALAAEQAGGGARVLEMAVEYAKTRMQFGRPIGSFQAIKHMCADMLLEVESMTSAARYAAGAADAGDTELPAVASLAKFACSDSYVQVAATNIQVHGGIGFTWEHPAHLYLRRARTDAQLLGDPAYHRERYLRHIEGER